VLGRVLEFDCCKREIWEQFLGGDGVTLLLNPTPKSKFFSLTNTHTFFGICREKKEEKREKRV